MASEVRRQLRRTFPIACCSWGSQRSQSSIPMSQAVSAGMTGPTGHDRHGLSHSGSTVETVLATRIGAGKPVPGLSASRGLGKSPLASHLRRFCSIPSQMKPDIGPEAMSRPA